eukprot:563810-Hanusia_phi.AAC.1
MRDARSGGLAPDEARDSSSPTAGGGEKSALNKTRQRRTRQDKHKHNTKYGRMTGQAKARKSTRMGEERRRRGGYFAETLFIFVQPDNKPTISFLPGPVAPVTHPSPASPTHSFAPPPLPWSLCMCRSECCLSPPG